MADPMLNARIDALPAHLRDQVDNYVAFLEHKYLRKEKKVIHDSDESPEEIKEAKNDVNL